MRSWKTQPTKLKPTGRDPAIFLDFPNSFVLWKIMRSPEMNTAWIWDLKRATYLARVTRFQFGVIGWRSEELRNGLRDGSYCHPVGPEL